MATKMLVNLATGLEDSERVTVAFLVGGAGLQKGRKVAMFLTKEAVRLALPGHAEAVACDGCPPLARLCAQFVEGGGRAAGVPDLLQRPPARSSRPARERDARGRHSDARMDG